MKTIFSFLLCLAGLMVAAQKPVSQIPFKLTSFNNILVPVVINKKDTLQLMLHTGSDYVTVIENSYKKMKSLTITDTITGVVSWGGSDDLKWSNKNTVMLGDTEFRDVPVFIDLQSGRESDGKIGLKFFEGKYLEINFDESLLSIYDEVPHNLDAYNRLSASYLNNTLYVEGFPVLGSSEIKTSFMIHTGYSGAVLFSDQFAKEHDLLNKCILTGESRMTDAAGNPVYTKKSVMSAFYFAGQVLKKVPFCFFDSTVRIQNTNILGGDIIKRYNLILSPALDAVYLNRNRHFNDPYFLI